MSPVYKDHRSTRYEPPVIDLENKNSSHTLLVELTGGNKNVLEVGTSTGYISRILKERGNTVTGIEIDLEAGEIAGQHCDSMIIGDIEKLDLAAHLTPSSFDVIMFGDVLEHLASPEDVLRKVKKYLRTDGYLAVSLPNVCHGDVILNLLMGNFKYTSMGLLDATHLRFFGLRNIIDLFNRCGYSISDVHTTVLPVGNTELKVDPGIVPEDLANFVKSLPNASVYQYVFKANPSPSPGAVEAVPVPDLGGLFREAIAESIQAETRPLLEKLHTYKAYVVPLDEQIERLNEEVQSLQQGIADRDAQITSLTEEIKQLTEESRGLQQGITDRDAQVASLNERVQQQAIQSIRLTNELAGIQQSIVWRLLMKYHNGFVEKVLPQSTRRRRFYDFGLNGCRCLLNEGPLKAWSKFVQRYISCSDCTKPCEIICNSPVSFQELSSFKELPRIAIIVVTYNSANFVKSALDSVLQLDYPLSLLELIVVDNNSTDNIEQVIHDFNQANAGKIAIKFIRNKKNYGFGKGNNIGASHASADVQYLLLLNPDCQLYEDTLDRLISSALSSVDRRFRLWECRQLPYEHPKHYNPVTLETTWSSAACCLIERAAFEEIRGFDENIFLYLEDVDLSWRLRMAGYRLMYLPLARALHNSYSEPNEVKATMYYNSLLYGYHMRYKFGSFWDILKYGGVYWYLICSPPNNLKNERKNLFMGYLRHFLLIPSALAFRIKNRRYLGSFRPLFYGFDFETHRPGAFVDLMNTEGDNVNPLPKVSVIVRTIGRKGFLREALVSIRNQTYPNVEVILVEDGPATLQEMLQSEFGDLDLKYFPLGENHGRCYAGTFGMAKSTGRYLRFLDEDDLLFAHSVETAVSFILKNKEKIKLVYDLAYEVPTEVVSEDPLQYKEYGYNVVIDEDFSRANLFHHNYIPIQCALFDRELYETCGGFDERLEVLEDWDLWIRYSMETDFLKIPMVTSLYRVPSDQNLRKRRQELLDSYYATVRKKYAPRIKGWKIKNY